MANAVKNHTVSRCYLDGWTDDSGQLVVEGRHLQRLPQPVLRPPREVGYKKKFWGEDEALRVAVERDLGADLEGKASRVLRDLPEAWPIDHIPRNWVLVLRFVALHYVRTPLWKRHAQVTQESVIVESLPEWKKILSAPSLDAFLRHLRADSFHTNTLLGHINKTATVLGCMHCTLLDCGPAALLTSDHPVVAVPRLQPWEVAPVQAIPATGLIDTIEIRFPISPRYALMFTWLDAHPSNEVIAAPYGASCDLNRSVAQQAQDERYYRPGDAPPLVCPPFLAGPCKPISSALFAGYAADAAIASNRRRHAIPVVNEMIEKDLADRVTILRIERGAERHADVAAEPA